MPGVGPVRFFLFRLRLVSRSSIFSLSFFFLFPCQSKSLPDGDPHTPSLSCKTSLQIHASTPPVTVFWSFRIYSRERDMSKKTIKRGENSISGSETPAESKAGHLGAGKPTGLVVVVVVAAGHVNLLSFFVLRAYLVRLRCGFNGIGIDYCACPLQHLA
ncbi:hypothetical protein IWX48DRAFT_171336 [Phyllosticta citricarpa]